MDLLRSSTNLEYLDGFGGGLCEFDLCVADLIVGGSGWWWWLHSVFEVGWVVVVASYGW